MLNWMGFPNDGAEAIARRLEQARRTEPLGVNIGRLRDTPNDDAGKDYGDVARRFARVADYFVLNVSSPNTPGLRQMQTVDALEPLIATVRQELEAERPNAPLLIKIAPDLTDEEIDAIARLAVKHGLAGIIATNTTSHGDSYLSHGSTGGQAGGLSGAPIKSRSIEVLRRLRARVGSDLVLVSVGGIESAEDAWERICAGASLLQAHTGFIYGGPQWPKEITGGLLQKVQDLGLNSVQEAIGIEAQTASGRGNAQAWRPHPNAEALNLA